MNPIPFNRLHELRMANDVKRYEMDEMRPRFDKLATRHEDGTAPQAVSAHQLFQTPPALAAQLVAQASIKAGSRVLEPSAGLGRILDALKPLECAEVVAVEMAAECAGVLFRQEREGVTIKQRDFLACSVADLGTFDAVVMNPPFTMRSDIKHIEHALQFIRPNGVLSALCMVSRHREEAFKARASTWEQIDGAFRSSGTSVSVFMFTIRK